MSQKRSLQTYRSLDYSTSYTVAKHPLTKPDGTIVPVGGSVDLAEFPFRAALRLVNARFLVHPAYAAAAAARVAAAGGAATTAPSETAVQRKVEKAKAPVPDEEGEKQLLDAFEEAVEEDVEGEQALLDAFEEEIEGEIEEEVEGDDAEGKGQEKAPKKTARKAPKRK